MNILLASTSPIKVEAIKRVFPDATITTIDCAGCELPEQPLNCGDFCARARLQYAKTQAESEYIISIENSVDGAPGMGHADRCHVVFERKGLFGYSAGCVAYPIDPRIMARAIIETIDSTDPHAPPAGTKRIRGLKPTIGELYHTLDASINHKNWVKTVYKSDRTDQICASITAAWMDLQAKLATAQRLIACYKTYPDYPKTGVVFEDFFAVIRERNSLQDLMRLLVSQCRLDDFDYVVGPESRGFFGFGLSCAGGYGFMPIRKAGKLPGQCHTVSYEKEYGSDTLELQADIPAGSRVLVFDDLIATAGSAKTARDLLEKAGCEIVGYVFLREVKHLRATAMQTLGAPYTVLLQD